MDDIKNNFDVSVSTVHRDLSMLEHEGRINKYYGQVSVSEKKELFKSRININVDLKRRMASKAVTFIRNGDCVFLDNSTTAYYLAEALCATTLKDILVVSNNGFISDLFLSNKNIDLVLTGGKLNKKTNSLVGPQAVKTIQDFNANNFFFSTSCISLKGGISDIYLPDVIDIKTKMLQHAKNKILLVDSTKFEKISTAKWFEIDIVDFIITDNKLPTEQVEEYRNAGIKIVKS